MVDLPKSVFLYVAMAVAVALLAYFGWQIIQQMQSDQGVSDIPDVVEDIDLGGAVSEGTGNPAGDIPETNPFEAKTNPFDAYQNPFE